MLVIFDDKNTNFRVFKQLLNNFIHLERENYKIVSIFDKTRLIN